MTKSQFLTAIKNRLNTSPQNDKDVVLAYYEEMIDDYIENGMSEEDAVSAMGNVDEIASQVLADTALPKVTTASRKVRAWEIILLVLGSPIWIPLLLAALIIIMAVYIVIWAVVVVLYAIVISLGAGAVVGAVGSAFLLFTEGAAQSLLFFGAGLICVGLTILMALFSNLCAIGMAKLSKAIFMQVKSLFVRKEAA